MGRRRGDHEGRGAIINIASMYGLIAPPGSMAIAPYTASKHGQSAQSSRITYMVSTDWNHAGRRNGADEDGMKLLILDVISECIMIHTDEKDRMRKYMQKKGYGSMPFAPGMILPAHKS